MAQQDMYGMFSNVTPEQAQAAYLNQFMVPQATLAQLNPYQQVVALVGQGAAQAGAGLGRLFGGKTSMEIEQAQMKDIMSQVADVQDPADRLAKAAALFRQRGMEDKAMALEDRSLSLKKTIGDISQTEAQTALYKAQAAAAGKPKAETTEAQKNALAYAATVAEPGTPEYTKAYADKFKELISPKPQEVTYGTDANVYARALYGKNFKDLTAEEATKVTKAIEEAEQKAKKAGASTVSIKTGQEENEFLKKLGETQAKRLGDAYTKRDAAVRELDTFNKLASIPDSQLISGFGSDVRVNTANFLDTLGVLPENGRKMLASSQVYQKTATDLVLARAKQLGYNPSNADRETIEKAIPNLSQNAEARRQITQFMAKAAQSIVDETAAMEEYAMKNKTLSGYKPKIPQVSIGGVGSAKFNTQQETLIQQAMSKNPKATREQVISAMRKQNLLPAE